MTEKERCLRFCPVCRLQCKFKVRNGKEHSGHRCRSNHWWET